MLPRVKSDLQQDNLNANLHQQEQLCIEELRHWLKVEENIYRQKSRVDWLKLGDANTYYFYAAMKHRHNRNRLVSIYGEDGVLYDEPAKAEVLKFSQVGTKALGLHEVDIATLTKGPKLSKQAQSLGQFLFRRLMMH